ncbi:MAG: NUDIX hydrolase [Leptolyngbyaceae cyanobacterium]|uniref:NUDIX hydrolase n=1 Tax=Leptodesmis sichuanensis TaxID=2906798 RepID=UPI001F2DAD26|nr:NUDIX hydrolase [Leptodesmis sichuanensis]UIE36977.1 NUDIX hydrolase [Leptodesmis sichuanensis A121]
MTETGPYWETRDRFLDLRSHWFRLIGEHLLNDQGQLLEYWRVERAHSVIVLPIQGNQIILMAPDFRPGVGQPTYDFPGGRLPDDQTPAQAAPVILGRELGIEPTAIAQLTPINSEAWLVNSSFSNQKLYGFVAHLQPSVQIPADRQGPTFAIDPEGMHSLLAILNCLQCRALALEWWLNHPSSSRTAPA